MILEITTLKLKDYDEENRTLFIKKNGKTNARYLRLNSYQKDIIDTYLNQCRPKLFRSDHQAQKALVLGKLGAPVAVEDINYLISTFQGLFPERRLTSVTIRMSVIANWLNEQNHPLEQVQLMAGHRWISATAKYRKLSASVQQDLVQRFHPLG
jgi:integrase/recombinase XerD